MQDVRIPMHFFRLMRTKSTVQESVTAAWVLDDVRLNIQKGQLVLDIMVYEYEVTKCNPHIR